MEKYPCSKHPPCVPSETRSWKSRDRLFHKDSWGWPPTNKGRREGGGGRRKRERGQPARDSWLANVPVSGFQFSPIISSRLESRQRLFPLLYTLSPVLREPSSQCPPPLPPPLSSPRHARRLIKHSGQTDHRLLRPPRGRGFARIGGGKGGREGKRGKWNPIPRIYKGHAYIRAVVISQRSHFSNLRVMDVDRIRTHLS